MLPDYSLGCKSKCGDDASSDGSSGALQEFHEAGVPLRIVRNEERQGLILSRTLGADLARGGFLCFSMHTVL